MFSTLKMPKLAEKCVIFTRVVKLLSTFASNPEALRLKVAISNGVTGWNLMALKTLNWKRGTKIVKRQWVVQTVLFIIKILAVTLWLSYIYNLLFFYGGRLEHFYGLSIVPHSCRRGYKRPWSLVVVLCWTECCPNLCGL